jgi:hypothetical protein
MIKPEQKNAAATLIKTTRQWLGLFIVLTGAVILVLEGIAVLPL